MPYKDRAVQLAALQWATMLHRCYDRKDPRYSRYGMRGIQVCQRWRRSFAAFLADMGPRPSARHTIDREDNDGDYTPRNCRWATKRQQARNRCDNVVIRFRGRVQCLTAWAEELGIVPNTLNYRLRRGWTIKRALTT